MKQFYVEAFEEILNGFGIRPFVESDATPLMKAADGDTFLFMPWRPETGSAEDFVEYIKNREKAGIGFAVLAEGEVVGSTSIYEISEVNRTLEIGWTWYAKNQRGTALNPSIKLILLTKCLEEYGAVRVQFKCDKRNIPSQKAMEKLGFVKEGILRSNMYMPHEDIWRDTVYYSVIQNDWSDVKEKLQERINLLS